MRNAFTRRRAAAVLAVAATTSVLLGTTTAAHADLSSPAPNGGAFTIFTEPTGFTGDPANAITGTGYWGHEGPGGAIKATAFSADATDGGAALLAAFPGVSDPSTQIGVAFVLSSADGSNEHPTVTSGETAGQAFAWFTTATLGSAVVGDSNNDSVMSVSTHAQYTDWAGASKPDEYIAGSDLKAHDLSSTTLSAHPKFTSILDTWAAGTHVSMVYFATDGFDSNGEPTVMVGSDGKAITAWQNFTTVGSASRSIATSAGYQLPAAPAINTSTTLSASPTSPQNNGTNVTLTAQVTQASGSVSPTGTVQFMDGTNPIGSPVNVNSTGGATISTSSLSVATHSLTAVYAPADGTFAASTSNTVTYVVNQTPATPTSTALGVNPGTSTAYQDVILTGTVTPSSAAGKVQFLDGNAPIGSPVVPDSTGVATLTTHALGAGSHTVTAQFIPTDSTAFTPSTSPAQTFTLAAGTCAYPVPTDGTTCTDDQTITADVDPGTLSISTPYTHDNPLNVGSLALNSTDTAYAGSAHFNNIIVSDLRSGDGANPLPWTVHVLAGDLTDVSGDVINGQNVGLTGLVPAATPATNTYTGTQVQATDVWAAAAAAATHNGTPIAPGVAGNLGLGGTQKTVLATTAGPGTATYNGMLQIVAPTSTHSGHYTGIVTFTVS